MNWCTGWLLSVKTTPCTVPCYSGADWVCCWMCSAVSRISHGGDATRHPAWITDCLVSSFPQPHQNCPGSIPGQPFFLQLGRRSPSSESSELSSKCTIVCSSLSCTQPVSWHFSPACCRGGHQDICSMMFIGLLVVLFRLKWTTIATSRSRVFFPHHSTNLHTRSLYSCSWPFLKQPTTAESSENFCRCYKSDLFLTSVVYRVKRKGNSTVSCGSLWCFGIK